MVNFQTVIACHEFITTILEKINLCHCEFNASALLYVRQHVKARICRKCGDNFLGFVVISSRSLCQFIILSNSGL